MVYRGYVRDGRIVMDEEARLPEGAEVEVTVRATNGQEQDDRPIEDVIAEISAGVPDSEWAKLPADLSDQLDHHVYGTPKQ